MSSSGHRIIGRSSRGFLVVGDGDGDETRKDHHEQSS